MAPGYRGGGTAAAPPAQNLTSIAQTRSVWELEAVFSEEVEEAADEIEQQAEETPVKELPNEEEERLRRRTERMREMARVAPDRAVLADWSLIEFETQEAAIRNDVDGSMGVSRMLKTLADRERIPEWVVDRVRDLRRLRAEADPQGPFPTFPTEAAIGYIDSVERLAKFWYRPKS